MTIRILYIVAALIAAVYNGESDSQYQILTMEHYLRVRKLP